MSASAVELRCVVLLGNPNTGKSTLFNALSGLKQQVGNYPGVTVEKKQGRFSVGDDQFTLIDLPGTYSLTPRSPDEQVTLRVLLGLQQDTAPPDLVLCVIDASNLERNLLLVNQLMSLGLPLVLALNMNDVAERDGVAVDVRKLEARLGVPIVPIHAQRRTGIEDLKRRIVATGDAPPTSDMGRPPALRKAIRSVSEQWPGATPPPLLVEQLLLHDDDTSAASLGLTIPGEVQRQFLAFRAAHHDDGLLMKQVHQARDEWIRTLLEGVVQRSEREHSASDRVDRWLMHPLIGFVMAIGALLLMFQAVFTVADPASVVIETLTGGLSSIVEAIIPPGALQSMLSDGVIAGVGGVLVFVPQIFLLFFFLALLEDSGYLARIACLLDGLMSKVGLSGKAVIPLLSSFACAIPGIMATRTIENPRHRLITILIAPLMTCSARLPVYTLLIAAFIPDKRFAGGLLGLQGLTMLGLFLLGIVTAIVVAAMLRRFLLPGKTPDFVLELPSYKWPSAPVVLRKMWDGGWSFVKDAGSIIVAVTILVWAAAYYPHNDSLVDPNLLAQRETITAELEQAAGEAAPALEDKLSAIKNQINGQRMRNSYLGRAGRSIEPLVKPLGWDWRIGCAVIASFPAREVVVATLGVLYNLGEEQDEGSESLRETLRKATWDGTDKPVFGIPVALSVMVFFALCAQCVSTLAIMRRETNSWRWPAFAFVYMTCLAYAGAWIVYRVALLFV